MVVTKISSCQVLYNKYMQAGNETATCRDLLCSIFLLFSFESSRQPHSQPVILQIKKMNQYSVFSQSQNSLCFLALITYTVGDRGNGNSKQQKQVIDFINGSLKNYFIINFVIFTCSYLLTFFCKYVFLVNQYLFLFINTVIFGIAHTGFLCMLTVLAISLTQFQPYGRNIIIDETDNENDGWQRH